LLNVVAKLSVVAGIVLSIVASFKGGLFGVLAFLCFFGGAGFWIYSAFVIHRQDKRLEDPSQTIKIRRLLNSGRFTVHATSPSDADSVEHAIRGNLAQMKQLIANSAEIRAKQTFEL
jgi:hypothetical protein